MRKGVFVDGALNETWLVLFVYSKSKEENCRFLSGLLATNGITYQFHSKSVYFFHFYMVGNRNDRVQMLLDKLSG